jgi:hypothetical protein
MIMLGRRSLIGVLVAGALSTIAGQAWAQAGTKFPDWSGQWRIQGGNRWDPTKPPGLKQEAPLTAEYQAKLEASINDQHAGGIGNDLSTACLPVGMPRMMTLVFAMEFVILPEITHMLFETRLPRRIYTDGRTWPNDIESTPGGYSIGKWGDPDPAGRFQTLAIETRAIKGRRNFEPTGIPLHEDNETVVTERLFSDATNPDILHNEITTFDHALTRPWTVTKDYHRDRKRAWLEANCTEANQHVLIGDEAYYISADGLLMPVKKDQPAPDLRYFRPVQK